MAQHLEVIIMDIKKQFTPQDKSRVRLEITIGQQDVSDFYHGILQKYAKTIQIPGFRKGKVPEKILEQKYGDAIKHDAEGDLINEAIEKAVETADKYEKPLAYSQAELDGTPVFEPGKDFSFAVVYDVFPKVEFKKLEGFEIEVPEASVKDEDMNRELEAIRERNGLVTDKEDGAPAENNDIATITYFETDDGENEIENSRRDGFVLTIGKSLDAYKLDEAVIGMKKGETKVVEKTYPEDYEFQGLAGQTKKFKITLDALKKNELPALDDELAQDVSEKYKTLDDLKADIRRNLQLTLENKISMMKTNSLLEKIIEANDFDLPESMVNVEMEARWRNLADRFRTDTSKLEKLMAATGSDKNTTFSNWRPETEKLLKSRVIVETLIQDRDISVTPEDVDAEIKKIAEKAGVSEEEAKKHYADPRSKEYLIDDIKEQRLYDQLLEKCTVKKGKEMSLEELLGDK